MSVDVSGIRLDGLNILETHQKLSFGIGLSATICCLISYELIMPCWGLLDLIDLCTVWKFHTAMIKSTIHHRKLIEL